MEHAPTKIGPSGPTVPIVQCTGFRFCGGLWCPY